MNSLRLFTKNIRPLIYCTIIFHHTQKVVARTYEIGSSYSLDETKKLVLSVAAWFHDTGHLFGSAEDHEKRSVLIMKGYLRTIELDASLIDMVAGCIMATKLPQHPSTLLEEILCDADTYDLGTEQFMVTDKLLQKEFELRNNVTYANWNELTLDLLLKHAYFTPYCQAHLNKGKQQNIEKVRAGVL